DKLDQSAYTAIRRHTWVLPFVRSCVQCFITGGDTSSDSASVLVPLFMETHISATFVCMT
uniref:Bestrophin homolog n=1 Tax=Ascaris lumbricoides TaxID=6252 RepID=A0A0M3HQV3_ASCLU